MQLTTFRARLAGGTGFMGRRLYLFILAVVVLVGVAGAMAIPGIRMRAHVVILQATGQIPDIPWSDLIGFLKPDSGVSLGNLVSQRNPHAVIRNPRTGDTDVRAGSLLYAEKCAACHGSDGSGSVASPPLAGVQFKHGVSDWAVYKTIRYGVPNTAMAPHSLDSAQLWQLVAFIRSMNVVAIDTAPLAQEQEKSVSITVPYEELRSIRHPSNDWLTYSGSYTSNRNSALKQVNHSNVGQLALKWIHQFEGNHGRVEASPIVRNGIMYVTVPPNRVIALDANSGKVIWKFQHLAPAESRWGAYAGSVNRGTAIMDEKLFFATSDARLIALSANTGRKVWESVIEEDISVYYVSGAPLAYKDLIVTGVSTKQVGRGAIVAYDANTGKERWRFHSIPGPGEDGNETWAGSSWRNGGASTWLTGSYDVENDILYWGVGNPKPDYIKAVRKGDNLYSNSVVALRGSTGELLWYFQFSPGDNHDWDSAQIPVLADSLSDGVTRKLLLWANRNGFYYILDRISGEFLKAAPFVHQTWAERIDANGRPVLKVENSQSRDGVLVFPSNGGGTNWWSPSYDPNLRLMFVPSLETGMVFFPGMDTNSPPHPAGPIYTAVRALDAFTGKLVWEHRHDNRNEDNTTGGLLSTQGGIVFGSDMSKFFALDSRTGKELWLVATGGKIHASPVTFALNGKQFVVIAAGGNLITFGLPQLPTRSANGHP